MLEIKEAYLNMKNNRTLLEIASKVVGKGEEDYAIGQLPYQCGIGINLDFIDS